MTLSFIWVSYLWRVYPALWIHLKLINAYYIYIVFMDVINQNSPDIWYFFPILEDIAWSWCFLYFKCKLGWLQVYFSGIFAFSNDIIFIIILKILKKNENKFKLTMTLSIKLWPYWLKFLYFFLILDKTFDIVQHI